MATGQNLPLCPKCANKERFFPEIAQAVPGESGPAETRVLQAFCTSSGWKREEESGASSVSRQRCHCPKAPSQSHNVGLSNRGSVPNTHDPCATGLRQGLTVLLHHCPCCPGCPRSCRLLRRASPCESQTGEANRAAQRKGAPCILINMLGPQVRQEGGPKEAGCQWISPHSRFTPQSMLCVKGRNSPCISPSRKHNVRLSQQRYWKDAAGGRGCRGRGKL